jgi:hypothetical protein
MAGGRLPLCAASSPAWPPSSSEWPPSPPPCRGTQARKAGSAPAQRLRHRRSGGVAGEAKYPCLTHAWVSHTILQWSCPYDFAEATFYLKGHVSWYSGQSRTLHCCLRNTPRTPLPGSLFAEDFLPPSQSKQQQQRVSALKVAAVEWGSYEYRTRLTILVHTARGGQ